MLKKNISFKQQLYFADIKFLLKTSSKLVIEELIRYFSSHEVNTKLEPAFEIEFEINEQVEQIRDELKTKATLIYKDKSLNYIKSFYSLEKKVFFLAKFYDGTSLISIDIKNKVIKVFFADEKEILNWRFINYPFLQSIQLFLISYDYIFMHAGAVASRDSAALIVGESGSGKSTITLKSVDKGLYYLSDDRVGLRKGVNGVEAISSPELHALLPDSRELFPHLEDFLCSSAVVHDTSDRLKYRFQISHAYPKRVGSSREVKYCIFLKKGKDEDVKLTPIRAVESLKKMYLESGIHVNRVVKKNYSKLQFEIFTDLVLSVESYVLEYSINDLDSVVRAIKGLLEKRNTM